MQLRLDVLAVPFTGHLPGGPRGLDADGEYFTPDTETSLDLYERVPLFWHHGKDASIGRRRIGHAENFRRTTEGWHCTAVVYDTVPRIVDRLRELADKGELFASSGAPHHLVEVRRERHTSALDRGHITHWPVAELSLTPSPANRHATARPSEQGLRRRRARAFAELTLLQQRARLLAA
jgi:hypothetical protein